MESDRDRPGHIETNESRADEAEPVGEEAVAGSSKNHVHMEIDSSSILNLDPEKGDIMKATEVDNVVSFIDKQGIKTDDITSTTVIKTPLIEETNKDLNTSAVKEESECKQEGPCVYYNIGALCKHSTTYELQLFPKRLLVILNNYTVRGYPTRLGTEHDVEELENTFRALGFIIEVNNDLSKNEVLGKLHELSNRNFADYGCISVAVLTHGENNLLLASDGDYYSVNDILDSLDPVKNPSLVTKPSILIIQSCRGQDSADGVPIILSPIQSTQDTNDQGEKCRVEIAEGVSRNPARSNQGQFGSQNVLYTLPNKCNCVILYSCYDGQTSHRPSTGSWFIQTFCKNVNEMGDTHHLEDIFHETKREIAIEMSNVRINIDIPRLEVNKQMPVILSTLINKLYFKKYEGKRFLQLQEIKCACDYMKIYYILAKWMSVTKTAILSRGMHAFDKDYVLILQNELQDYNQVHKNIILSELEIRQNSEKDNTMKILLAWLHKIKAELRDVPFERQTSEYSLEYSSEYSDGEIDDSQKLEQIMEEINNLTAKRLTALQSVIFSLLKHIE